MSWTRRGSTTTTSRRSCHGSRTCQSRGYGTVEEEASGSLPTVRHRRSLAGRRGSSTVRSFSKAGMMTRRRNMSSTVWSTPLLRPPLHLGRAISSSSSSLDNSAEKQWLLKILAFAAEGCWVTPPAPHPVYHDGPQGGGGGVRPRHHRSSRGHSMWRGGRARPSRHVSRPRSPLA